MSETQTKSGPAKLNLLRFSPWHLLTAACLVLALTFVAWPIFAIIVNSFIAADGSPMDGWREFFEKSQYLRGLRNSLLLGVIVTCIATAIGVFLAYFTSRFSFWGKSVIALLPISAILVPEIIVTQAWLMFLGNNGIITRFLRDTFGLELPSFYGWTGLIVILPLVYYTFVYLGALAAMKSFDSQLEEAAMSLGSAPIIARLRVTIPTLLPAVSATSILVFTLTIGNFTTSTIIGGPVDLLAPMTYSVFLAETGGNPVMQSTLATVALAVVALVMFLQRVTVGKRRYEMVQGRSWAPKPIRGIGSICVAIGAGILLVASLLPVLMVIVLAFTDTSGPVMNWGTFSTDNFTYVLSGNLGPVLNTLKFGLIACAIGIVVSVVIAVLVVKKRNWFTPGLDYVVMLPMALSGTVLGIGMANAFGTSSFITLTGTGAIIVLVFVVRRLPHGIRNASASLYSVPDSLEDASVSLGVPPFRSFLKVVLPLMIPGIAAATVLTWTTMIAELAASIVVYSPGSETITIRIFQLMGTGLNGEAAVYGLILLVLAITPIVIATRVFRIRLFT